MARSRRRFTPKRFLIAIGAPTMGLAPITESATDAQVAPAQGASVSPECRATRVTDIRLGDAGGPDRGEAPLDPATDLSTDSRTATRATYITHADGEGEPLGTMVIPPRGWAPSTATDAELQAYGFDRRPTESAAPKEWSTKYQRYHWDPGHDICINPELQLNTFRPSLNWAGVGSFNGCCGYSSFVTMSGGRVRLHIDIRCTGDPAGADQLPIHRHDHPRSERPWPGRTSE